MLFTRETTGPDSHSGISTNRNFRNAGVTPEFSKSRRVRVVHLGNVQPSAHPDLQFHEGAQPGGSSAPSSSSPSGWANAILMAATIEAVDAPTSSSASSSPISLALSIPAISVAIILFLPTPLWPPPPPPVCDIALISPNICCEAISSEPEITPLNAEGVGGGRAARAGPPPFPPRHPGQEKPDMPAK
mmetsp:Transcript_36467/g.61893  ORF Transcript_36467/g.61893 Transcript_36467/m.61893 type:complete len:188 (+) Transcript_36467:80-643(+)